MLLNAFSYLPYRAAKSGKWRLIYDFGVAKFLRSSSRKERDERLLMTLEEALDKGLKGTDAMYCRPIDTVVELASNATIVPYLVMSDKARLCGIITAFDLL